VDLTKTGSEDKAMKDFFKPELRNRIDVVCRFQKLDKLAIKKIVIKFVDELKTSLASKNIRISLDESVIDHLAEVGYDPKMGARPLARKIDELIRVPLSKKILFDQLSDCSIIVSMADDQIDFRVDQPDAGSVQPGVDNNGYIVVSPGT
jgi:ATP-dependent Clp protease ATP-binding subunit ClpA